MPKTDQEQCDCMRCGETLCDAVKRHPIGGTSLRLLYTINPRKGIENNWIDGKKIALNLYFGKILYTFYFTGIVDS